MSPDPVGRTLAWRCFSAAGSAIEKTVDEDPQATAAIPPTGGGPAPTGISTGGLADPSEDSRRLTFPEFRRAMLNVAQSIGVPVYLGGRSAYCYPVYCDSVQDLCTPYIVFFVNC